MLGFDGPTSPTDPLTLVAKVIVDQGPVEIDCKGHSMMLDSYLGDLQVDLLVDKKLSLTGWVCRLSECPEL